MTSRNLRCPTPQPDEAQASSVNKGPTANSAGDTSLLRLLSARVDLSPGSQLGTYKILAEIGRGGMGTVFRGFHTRLHKHVAIKVLPTSQSESREGIERFEREMEIVGQLQHPHIVVAHDGGEIEGLHYLVMELIEGENLEQIARVRNRLSICDSCALIQQAAAGLHYAHSRGLVHRDVKPSNLMLDRNGIVKILDLGLARWSAPHLGISDLTASGHWLGTLLYMAPEQAENAHGVGAAADLYSLGATLYRLLSGRAPIGDPASNPVQLLSVLMHGSIEPLERHRPECPAELAALVHQMLARTPADRPGSAAEVAERLGAFSAGADLKWLLPSSSGDSGEAAASSHSRAELPASDPVNDDLSTPLHADRASNADASSIMQRSDVKIRRLRLIVCAIAGLALAAAGLITLWSSGILAPEPQAILRVSYPGDTAPEVRIDGQLVAADTRTPGMLVIDVAPGVHKLSIEAAGATWRSNTGDRPLTFEDGETIDVESWPAATPEDTARWVIEFGGYVATLDAEGGVRFVNSAEPALPSKPYVITRVWLPDTNIADDDLRRLA
ncbi:MAG TPA: serine/threonine-protein kinase, partial [Pirellulaceae bacterium]|nr:serine/threonine-protein kinase [Pirellulaceae bacterium]